MFVKCKTAFHEMDHTLKLTYGDHKIDVSVFLVSGEVRGMVTNGLCQSYPARKDFHKCGHWGTDAVTYGDSIAYADETASSMIEFKTRKDGPSSCHASGWISKIGEQLYSPCDESYFLTGILKR